MKTTMQWARRQSGFTIVELLIVVVVIAILAAITIVAYNGVTKRASDAAAQSALNTVQKKLAEYTILSDGAYPASLADVGITSSGGAVYQYSADNSTTPKGYCVTVTTKGATFYIGSNYSWAGHSTTGTPFISNLKANPGLEVSANGFGGPNSSTFSRDTTRARSGMASLRVSMPAAAGNQVGVSMQSVSAIGEAELIKPNREYNISAYVYVPAATVAPFITVQGSGRATRDDPNERTTTVKDQWVRIYNSFVTGETGNITIFILNMTTTATAGTYFFVDDIMITEGGKTPPVYADGNSPGWSWTGTPELSISAGPAL